MAIVDMQILELGAVVIDGNPGGGGCWRGICFMGERARELSCGVRQIVCTCVVGGKDTICIIVTPPSNLVKHNKKQCSKMCYNCICQIHHVLKS